MMLMLEEIDEAMIELRLVERLLRNGFGDERAMIKDVISKLEERKEWTEKRLSAADREDDDFLRHEYYKHR